VNKSDRRLIRVALQAFSVAVIPGILSHGNPNHARADGATLTGSQIAERAVRPDALNWVGGRARVRMVLTDSTGKARERAMEVTGRKKDGRYQSLVRVLNPADVAGMAFLVLERGNEESEQYIYLPGLKRTRRIAGRERDGSFMGSDFTYADMQGVDSKQAKHARLADEKVGSELCYLIESTLDPIAKVVTWVRQSDFVALRTKFYDRNGKLAKTLYTRRIKNVDGTLMIVEARMQNEQASHTTDLFVDSVERRDDLADSQFTPSALEHL
jgi:hypothetical protein